mmetsp:Transcript_172/g.551  ORF Transcript_172/g.551 Transcript_172/m.551 type:complete len:319 (+) Transcript_172:3-959(+)
MAGLAARMRCLQLLSLLFVTSNAAFNKIGFHLGPGGDHDGILDYLQELDAAKIPFSIKNVDTYDVLDFAVNLTLVSGVNHSIIYRDTSLDIPDYSKDPADAAAAHWALQMARMPPNFNKQLVWLELINEPDQTKGDWLGQFGVAAAKLAMDQGYKIAMFAFSTGTPYVGASTDPYNSWETPGMQEYLKLCAQYPDLLAVSLHEYSLDNQQIMTGYPYLIGRFQFLFETCDNHSIARPTLFITEWGWGASLVPDTSVGVPQMMEVAAIYAQHETLQSANMWYLGPGFGGIAEYAVKYIQPVKEYTLNHTFPGPNATGWL